MKYKLICFDIDGTLIDDTEYIWVTLHDAFKVPLDIRKQHYEDFISKRITYQDWVDLDILEWKKRSIKKNDIESVIKSLKVMHGARETVLRLKSKGLKVAVVSGSLDIVLDTLLPEIHFDYKFMNKITFKESGHILEGIATPYDMEHKASGLKYIAKSEGISLDECIFVGDNENDIHIAEIAGFSIAFNSKSKNLNEISDVIIEEKDLTRILDDRIL